MAKVTSDKKKRIAIIGGGHMGSALARGFARAGISRSRIFVSDRARDNARVVRRADAIFIAVKPSVVRDVLAEIGPYVRDKLVVSAAAGVRMSTLKKALRKSTVARIMPNILVAYGEGVVGLYTEDANARNYLKKLLSRLGLVVDVRREKDLDALTLVAGCGPAIVASFVDMLAERARALDIKGSEALARQIFKGTLTHLERSGLSARELVSAVTTKGGVTEAILKYLRRDGFEKSFAGALRSGHERIKRIRV